MTKGTSKDKSSRRYIVPILMGLTGTAIAIAIHFSGIAHRVEWLTLDLRFRHCSEMHDPEPTIFIDLDDSSIREIGRWPWPREILAGVIESLNESGARTLMIDMMFPSPQEVRYISEADEIYSGNEAPLEGNTPLPVFDDILMTDAVRKGDNVFFATAFIHIYQMVEADRKLIELVRKEMEGLDEPSLKETLDKIRKSYSGEWNTSVQTVATREYLRLRAMDFVEKFSFDTSIFESSTQIRGEILPPLLPLTAAARGTGFVTTVPDGDGIVRRFYPVLEVSHGKYIQLSLAVARDELGRRYGTPVKIDVRQGVVVLSCPNGTRREIPVDDKGRMLLAWDTRDTQHISIRLPSQIHILRKAIERDRKLERITQDMLAIKWDEWFRKKQEASPEPNRTVTGNMDALNLNKVIAREIQLQIEVRKAQREAYRNMLYHPKRVSSRLAELRKNLVDFANKVDGMAAEFIEYLDFALDPSSRPGTDKPVDRKFFDECASLHKRLKLIEKERQTKEQEIQKNLRRLRSLVEGKICLIGSTSTGAADFVATPVHNDMPGVQVHYRMLNSILSGRFMKDAPWYLDMLAILVPGLLISLITATRPIIRAGALTLVIAFVFVIFNAYSVFRVYRVNMTMVAPLAAIALSFIFITMYRQLTEEREKRRIRGMFAHALSPVLVDQIIEDPSTLHAQKRVLSCMFSDLAGFTSMSEKLGPQETVRLLNRYFDGVDEIVQHRHNGYLNKFLGDGIFVFFGAPVFMENHASRAIRAAIDCQDAVIQLNHALEAETGHESNLRVRIGITTGEAMVGDCGSSRRSDYTAIGDPVNQSSRLESACKFFGTRILVDGRTWQEGGEPDIVARPLGEIYISGVSEAVTVHQVFGLRDKVDEQIIQSAEDFAIAVDKIRNRDFADALEILEEVLGRNRDDSSCRIYRDFCLRHKNLKNNSEAPEIKDPNGVVRLNWME